MKPYFAVVPAELAYEYKHYKWFASFYRQMFRTWLTPEFMTIEAQNLVCNPDNKGFKDLAVRPVAFGQKQHEYVNEVFWMYNSNEITKRESVNA